jgi:hypothetical protein
MLEVIGRPDVPAKASVSDHGVRNRAPSDRAYEFVDGVNNQLDGDRTLVSSSGSRACVVFVPGLLCSISRVGRGGLTGSFQGLPVSRHSCCFSLNCASASAQ